MTLGSGQGLLPRDSRSVDRPRGGDENRTAGPLISTVKESLVNRRLGTGLAVFIEAEQPTDVVAVIRGNGPSGRLDVRPS
jgi:hypothetical protein